MNSKRATPPSAVDWEGFRVLLAVADRGSFSAAAAALGISQPTVGRAIAALEDSLSVRLLVRRTRGVVPTEAGERVIADARRMAEGASAAVRHASSDAAALDTVVRISATEGLGALWLPSRLHELRAQHPQLRLELVVDNAAVDLATRKADVAVRLFRPTEGDLVARKVARLGFGFYASKVYLAKRGVPRRLADLEKHDLVGLTTRGQGGVEPTYMRWLRREVPDARFPIATSSLLAQYEAARAGLGVVLGTCAVLSRAGETELTRVLPRIKPPSMDVWLTAHEDVRKNAAVAKVYDFLCALFVAEADALAS